MWARQLNASVSSLRPAPIRAPVPEYISSVSTPATVAYFPGMPDMSESCFLYCMPAHTLRPSYTAAAGRASSCHWRSWWAKRLCWNDCSSVQRQRHLTRVLNSQVSSQPIANSSPLSVPLPTSDSGLWLAPLCRFKAEQSCRSRTLNDPRDARGRHHKHRTGDQRNCR